MGKKKNKIARLEQPPKPSTDRYPLRSKNTESEPSQQWSAMAGNMDPAWAFNAQAPLWFHGMSMFNISTAQPNLSGTQTPNMFGAPQISTGTNTYQPGLAPLSTSVSSIQNGAAAQNSPTNAELSTAAASNKRKAERPPISAPSAASGGVPEPTPAYTMRASFLPKRREHPGPLLVVIDLNGTLLHRPDRRHGARFEARQHAHPFVTYCVETFWVIIWSSARPENVRRMVDQLLTPQSRKQVVAVWGRDRFGLTEADYNARTQCYKRLTSLWDDPLVRSAYPRTRPGFEGGCWNQGNTVLIDDSAEKARSEPHNAITLPEFTGGADVAADVLPRVHDYLNELCYQEDVSAFMRANPFKMA